MPENLDSYLGVDKPEEKETIEMVEDPIKNLHNAFKVWSSFIQSKDKYPLFQFAFKDDVLDHYVEETANIVSKQLLPKDIIGEEYFPPEMQLNADYHHYLGIFYTALLNAGVEKLVIPGRLGNLVGCGYKLQRGILEFRAKAEDVGKYASGGCIINYGTIKGFLGYEASGGIIANLRDASSFGQKAKDGFFINCGGVIHDVFGKNFGLHAKGGIFVDYEKCYPVEYKIKCPGLPVKELVVQGDANTTIGKLLNDAPFWTTKEIDILKLIEFANGFEQELKVLCTKI